MSKTFDQGKDEVAKLCRFFATNQQGFHSPGVKEAHIRQQLIDPFFVSLGWDVRNETMTAPQYREVVPEDSLEIEGQQKAPDYTFRVGSQPKFFAEAKKCGVNINLDPGPAFQLRRYGFSAKVVLSILTDFEELGVYDCSPRPKPGDKASFSRIQYFQAEEYPERWRELWDVFSREAVWSGAFDQYAASKRKRGTSEVDAEFLKEIEGWRFDLARNIALRNGGLSPDDLNFAVQMTIDRIIFLRMAEDRGIEPPDQLLKLCERQDIYAHFVRVLCQKADEKYNSGLFHFQKETGLSEAPDRLTPCLKIDDKIFKSILQSLYFEHGSPYEFKVMPVEILGTVYERFLGKVIRLTEGHQAKIDEKPEVRKAGGVYYTPSYIVDYIVKNTVGKKIEGRSPAQLAGKKSDPPFRVLDMACGSGSFLLGAYQRLLDHCLTWYQDHKPETYKKAVYKDSRKGEWRLSIEEKKRILTAHIFGVDIDPQAVEVTKLSLSLKVLEGETDQTFDDQMKLFQTRALPNLSDNIKRGNSLISPDYFSGRLIPDPEELNRVNPFDWNQGFPEAMKAGGFDCVIGNPPWGADLTMVEKRYLMSLFAHVHMRTPDTFNYFLAKAYSITRRNGKFGMIIPNNFLFQHEYAKSRQFFVQEAWLEEAINLGDSVFATTAPSCIVIINNKEGSVAMKKTATADLRIVERDALTAHLSNMKFSVIDVNSILNSPDSIIPMDKKTTGLIARILKSTPTLLDDVCEEVAAGIGTGGDKIFRIDDKIAKSLRIEKDILHPLLVGREMNAYFVPQKTGHSIIYSTKVTSSQTHPHTLDYLKPFQVQLSHKRETQKGLIPWWSLHWPRYPGLFDSPKIVMRQTANSLYAAIDEVGYYCLNSIINVRPKNILLIKYYLGLLNSRLLRWLYGNFTQEQRRAFAEVKPVNLRKLPIRSINFSDRADLALHDKMIMIVETMLTLNKQLADSMSAAQKEIIQRQIDATDRKIDQLVYELYGLTKDEIKIVEGETK